MQQTLRQSLLRGTVHQAGAAAVDNAAATLTDSALQLMTTHPELTLQQIAEHVVASGKMGGFFGAVHAGKAEATRDAGQAPSEHGPLTGQGTRTANAAGALPQESRSPAFVGAGGNVPAYASAGGGGGGGQKPPKGNPPLGSGHSSDQDFSPNPQDSTGEVPPRPIVPTEGPKVPYAAETPLHFPPETSKGESHQDQTQEQRAWLEQKAQAAGYESSETMRSKAPEIFKNLNQQWQYLNVDPKLRNTEINAINEKLYGKPTNPTVGSGGASFGEPRGISGDTLEAALNEYRRNAGASAPASGSTQTAGSTWWERYQQATERERGLIEWARQKGILLDKLPDDWRLGGPNDVGRSEHHAFPTQGRYLKVSKGYGLYPRAVGKSDWKLDSTGLENYFQRIIDQNRETGTDIELHGLLQENPSSPIKIITSQKVIKGESVDPDFIRRSMAAQGFHELDNYANYYNPKTNTAVLDLHDENALRHGDVLLPFDVIVMHPEGKLRDIFTRRAKPIQLPPPNSSQQTDGSSGLHATPLRHSSIKGRAGLDHLPDNVPATERQRYGLLRSAVGVYQSRFPVLRRRFRKGTTEGRSGLECQFRDASGRITPKSVRDALIAVQEDKLAADMVGLSVRHTVFHMEHALGEEVRHLASMHALLTLWEHSGRQQALEPWLVDYCSRMWWEDFTSELRAAVAHAYVGNQQRGGGYSQGTQPQDWQLALEGIRMFSQARAGTLPTESDQLWQDVQGSTDYLSQVLGYLQHVATRTHLPPKVEWMLQAMDQLMRMWHVPRQAMPSVGIMRRAA